jgi:hypothetical protein
MGVLRLPVVTLAERAGAHRVVGLFPGPSPFWAFSAEVPLLSIMAASSGCKPQSSEAISESCNEVMVFLVFFFFLSNVPVIYRHG